LPRNPPKADKRGATSAPPTDGQRSAAVGIPKKCRPRLVHKLHGYHSATPLPHSPCFTDNARKHLDRGTLLLARNGAARGMQVGSPPATGIQTKSS